MKTIALEVLALLAMMSPAVAHAQTYFTTTPDSQGSFTAFGPGLPTLFYSGDGHGNYIVTSPNGGGNWNIMGGSNAGGTVIQRMGGDGNAQQLPVIPGQ